MGILDGIVEWIAEQVMNGLDIINTSVLGALGCNMDTFKRYFPVAETMYKIFVALAIGLILLNWVWQLFKNYGLSAGIEAEDPVKLSIRSILFILLAYFADEIVNIILKIGGTPYQWILNSELPPLDFASFNSVFLTILGVCASGTVALIALILILILAWNYIKLLFEAAERYVLLGVLVFTAPVAFAMGASQTTSNIFKSWCRMFGGQVFLLLMNAWCLRLFTSMVGQFLSNPLALYSAEYIRRVHGGMCPNASCCDKRPATEVIQHFQRPLCKSKRYQTYETFFALLALHSGLGCCVFCSRTVSTKVLVQSGSFPVAVLFI